MVLQQSLAGLLRDQTPVGMQFAQLMERVNVFTTNVIRLVARYHDIQIAVWTGIVAAVIE